MKEILNNWRNYCLIVENENKQLKENLDNVGNYEDEDDDFDEDESSLSQDEQGLETVGDLRKIINISRFKSSSKEAAIAAIKTALGAIPGAGGVISVVLGATDIIDAIRQIYGFDDDNELPPALKKLNVDDKTSYIVDDKLEAKFLNFLLDKFEKMPPETPLEDFDSTELLNQFLDSNFEREVKKT